MSVLLWAHLRSTKSAVKMHTLLDLRGNIPSFIRISDGKPHDVHALDMLIPEPGAIYVMDRGYIDFAHLHNAASGGHLRRHPRQVQSERSSGLFSAHRPSDGPKLEAVVPGARLSGTLPMPDNPWLPPDWAVIYLTEVPLLLTGAVPHVDGGAHGRQMVTGEESATRRLPC
jgi:hypothetical protein